MKQLPYEAPKCPKCNSDGSIGAWTSTIGPHVYVDVAYCTMCGHIIAVLPHASK